MAGLPFDIDDPRAGRPLPSGIIPGRIRLWRSGFGMTEDPWRVYCKLGTERPYPTEGYGGAGQIDRAGRRAVSTVDGMDLLAFRLELMIEREVFPQTAERAQQGVVAAQMRMLERLAGLDRMDDDAPPLIKWSGNAHAHDHFGDPETEWMVVRGGLSWGESESSDRGTLLWQFASLDVRAWRDTQIRGLKRQAFRRETLRAGESLRAFAGRTLDNRSRWKDVAELNRDNARCPRSPHFEVSKPVSLLVPPREGRGRGGR